MVVGASPPDSVSDDPSRDDTASPVLEASGLRKHYGRSVRALDTVDLSLARGGITAVVGPNGAGKSTLIRCWAGFERPSSGHVRVLGFDPWRQRSEALRRTGYVPQSPTLYDTLSLDDHLVMAGQLRPGFDRPFAESRLARLGIRSAARGRELSGGQQAQVALTLALGTHADVMLLDEPLADLDPLARREFLQLVAETASDEGTTVLLSSHIVTDIQQVCDRLIILGGGRVLAHAPIGDLLASHVVSSVEPAEADVVGSFSGTDARLRWLVRRTSPGSMGSAATLDEIVVGYLSAAKQAGSPEGERAA